MQVISAFFENNPLLKQIAQLLLMIVIALAVVAIVFRIERKIAEKLHNKKKNLNIRMIENGFKFLIIFLVVQWVLMSSDLTKNFGTTLFQGTAVLTAIAGFAAQNALADILCGMLISVTKPFDIGNRIVLDNGTAGIVVDMTLRHVVLRGLDDQMYVIPNSKMNAHEITNLSWHKEIRAVDLRFHVTYDCDPEAVRKIIHKAIMDSPLSVPGKAGEKYADVYFLAIEDYSLLMGTTAYYQPSTPTEVFKTDINTRVWNALKENNIEIPYQVFTIQQRDS